MFVTSRALKHENDNWGYIVRPAAILDFSISSKPQKTVQIHLKVIKSNKEMLKSVLNKNVPLVAVSSSYPEKLISVLFFNH